MRRRFVDLGLRWILALVSTIAAAQQVPFVHFTGANAPNTSSSLFEDKRGGLLMGGNEGTASLTFFDGNRFIP